MSMFDTFMADTVGVVYRAGTGKVDPWTKQELADAAAADLVRAGMTPEAAQTQAEKDTEATTASSNVSYADAARTTFGSAFSDNGSGCGITNIGGCVPPWVAWAAVGVGVLVVLYVLGPYVGLFERRAA